ncbi:MAG: alternative ribosome rescue aminoacyl-tRNA hydrolase ArfB [Pseudomonadota bacterium]
MTQSSSELRNTKFDRYLPPESELNERFLRSSGPGGQHVNRTESAVQLRFDSRASQWLNHEVLDRLLMLAGQRADQHGVITIESSEHRSQLRNRQAARSRLAELIEQAHRKPKPRRATAPSAAQRRARLDEKKRRSQRLKLRRKPDLRND